MSETKKYKLDVKTQNDSLQKVCLWHTADTVFSLESFIKKGAQAIGKGVGGQSRGFYVWNQKKCAIHHFSDFLWKDMESETLLVCTKVDKNDLKYPDWQFDLETSKQLNALLFKYRDNICEIKDLKYKDKDGQDKEIKSIEKHELASEKACYFYFTFEDNKSYTTDIGNGTEYLDLFQALIDRMCKDKDFRNDYNKLLQDSVESPYGMALKYCGKEELFVNEISYIQKKKHTAPVVHTIYLAEKGDNDAENYLPKKLKEILSEDLLQLKMDIIKAKLGSKMGKTAIRENGKFTAKTPETLDTAETQKDISKLLMKAWMEMKKNKNSSR